MKDLLITYDLGTGGVKASLITLEGRFLSEFFHAYETFYPHPGWHEQRPRDWWEAVKTATRMLLAATSADPNRILAAAISGHSLGVVPLDSNGSLLRERTPIWSDSRSVAQASKMFERVDEIDWYMKTGNGFPPAHYAVFKIMWYRDHEPDMFRAINKVIGTKDYINFMLTGRMVTDHSYASGSGVYDLVNWQYSDDLIQASGLEADIFPEIVPSTQIIGTLLPKVAEALGLPRHIQVAAGGVDNSCMAVGAGNIREGAIYNNQGSSSGIAITSRKPILDAKFRPFVFTAIIPGLFNSAVPVFSAGTSFRWVRDAFCCDLIEKARVTGVDVYDLMTEEAAKSPAGARGVIFHPNMAGGSSIDPSPKMRGAFIGLDLGHRREDVLRAAMEGIALELGYAANILRTEYPIGDKVIVVGGGSRSKLWRQIYADIYKLQIIKTNIDQQAAALGAAAAAAVGAQAWDSFEKINEIISIEDVTQPKPEHEPLYQKMMQLFEREGRSIADIASLSNQEHLS